MKKTPNMIAPMGLRIPYAISLPTLVNPNANEVTEITKKILGHLLIDQFTVSVVFVIEAPEVETTRVHPLLIFCPPLTLFCFRPLCCSLQWSL
jgi:hypothetical protein